MVLMEEQNGWLHLFEFCFGFTLTSQDQPRLLCQTCAEKIQNYVKFKEKCHKSHNLWKMVISDVGFENHSTTQENDNHPVTNITHVKNETFDSIFDDEYEDSIFSNNDEFQIPIDDVKTEIDDVKTEIDDVEMEIDDDTKSKDELNSDEKNDCIDTNIVESEQTKCKTVSISNGCVRRERKKVYTCAKCKCVYGKKNWFLKHIKVCRGMKKKVIYNPEYCYYLGRKYDGQNIDNKVKQEPQNEQIIGNKYDSLACGLCNLSFSDYKDVCKHLEDHWSNNDLACKLCDFVGVDLAAIISHRFSHLPRNIKLFVCHICEKSRKSVFTLHFHYRKEHLNKPGGYCSRCNKEYHRERPWKKHERTHAAPKFICDICGKNFNHKSSLVVHIKNHMHQTKSICDICGKVMSRERYLKTHKETVHYNAEPIKCNHCNRMFKSDFSLRLHMKNLTKVSTLECEVCHKSFVTPNLLRSHMIIHSDEKPYSCDFCGSKYKRKAHLTAHLLKHSRLFPQCLICMKKFTTKRSLSRHAAVHTGVRRYRCTVASCEKTFNDRKQMLTHLQRRHKSETLEKNEVVQEEIV